MSIEAIGAVFQADLDPVDKLVMLILADGGDGAGDLILRCRPEYVAKLAGIPTEEVIQRVYRLAAEGVVDVGPREDGKLVVDIRRLGLHQ